MSILADSPKRRHSMWADYLIERGVLCTWENPQSRIPLLFSVSKMQSVPLYWAVNQLRRARGGNLLQDPGTKWRALKYTQIWPVQMEGNHQVLPLSAQGVHRAKLFVVAGEIWHLLYASLTHSQVLCMVEHWGSYVRCQHICALYSSGNFPAQLPLILEACP